MKKFFASALTSIILLAAGICLAIKPDTFMNFICYIAGGIAILISAIKFISAYKKNTIAKEAATCIVLLILGIVLIVLQASILEVFPLIIGICFLVYGLLKLHTAFMFKNTNESAYKKLLISALIGIALAIAIIALYWLATDIILRLIGVLLIYNSIENIFSSIVAKPELDSDAKNSKKTKKGAVEAQVEESADDVEGDKE